MRQLVKVLEALSYETRLRILNLLLERECCVCEIEWVLGISESAASRNLKALYDVDIIKQKRAKTWTLYQINDEDIPQYYSKLIDIIREATRDNSIIETDREKLRKLEPMVLCNVTRRELSLRK